MLREHVFVLESESTYAQLISDRLILEPEFELQTFSSGQGLLAQLYRQPLCIILSTTPNDISLKELVLRIREFSMEPEIVLLIKPAEIEFIPEFIRLDLWEVLVKDSNMKHFIWLLIKRLNRSRKQRENRARLNDLVFKEIPEDYQLNQAGSANKKTLSFVRKATQNKAPVLLYSRPGSEPEKLALLIHTLSKSTAGPFEKANLRLWPKEKHFQLLFGGRKAGAENQGLFQKAAGGTLYLAHPELLSDQLQDKLLRSTTAMRTPSLQPSEASPLTRLILSTEKSPADLEASSKIEKSFLEQLNRQSFRIIPLNEKPEEIAGIAQNYIEQYCRLMVLPLKKLTPAALLKLKIHPFPDDVRELKEILRRAIELSSGDTLDEIDLVFPDPAYNLSLNNTNASDHAAKVQRVAYYLKVFDNNVNRVARHLNIGKSTIYRYREEGLVDF